MPITIKSPSFYIILSQSVVISFIILLGYSNKRKLIKTLSISLLALSLLSTLNASPDAQKLLEDKCSSCHMLNSATQVKQEKISAPPMWGIMRKIGENFKTKEEANAFIISYTKNPTKEKMIFPQATQEHFGLMPSMKNELSDEELTTIAEYLTRNW